MNPESDFSARQVSAVLEIGTVTVPVIAFELVHNLDELPTARVTVALDNQNQADSTDIPTVAIQMGIASKLGRLFQEKVFNHHRLKPDVRFSVTDGNGIRLVFNGFLTRPLMQVMEGQLTISIGLTHAMTVLQAWNGQIYHKLEPYVIPDWTWAFDPETASADAQRAPKSESPAVKLLAFVEACSRRIYQTPDLNDPHTFDFLPVHNLNLQVVPLIRQMLLVSEPLTAVEGLADDTVNFSNLYSVLRRTLLETPNFLVALRELCAQFMLQMNADWAGNLWLEKIQNLDDPEDRVIQIPTQNLSFDLTHQMELPLSQVIVVGAASGLYGQAGTQGINMGQPASPDRFTSSGLRAASEGRTVKEGELWAVMQCMAKYPEQIDRNAVGNVVVVEAPFWINDDNLTNTKLDDITQQVGTSGSKLDRIVTAQRKIQDRFLAANVPRQKLLKYVAQQMFTHWFLQSTRAHVVSPLDFRICVGRTYRVNDLNGQELFTGFLNQVRHEVKLSGLGQAEASTSMQFSHVRVTGAKLVQLEAIKAQASQTTLGPDAVDSTFRPPTSVMQV